MPAFTNALDNPIRAKLDSSAEELGEQAPIQIARVPGMVPEEMFDRDKLTRWLREEINRADSERAAFVRKIRRWKIAYRAPINKEPKHFPIFNSSNLVIPVIKENVNVLAAQIVQATLTARPRWVFQDMNPEWEPFIDPLEDFMDLASDRDLEAEKHLVPWIIEISKLGTGVLEVGHEIMVRKNFRYTSDGGTVYPKEEVVKDGAAMAHVPLDKFWIRFRQLDVQRAPWVAKQFFMNENELREFAAKNQMHSVEEVIRKANGGEDATPVDRAMEEIEETKPVDSEHRYEIFEVWCSFMLEGESNPTELKVYFERSVGMLMGEFFNPFHHGCRPFIKGGYFPVEDRFYDEGLCEMLEQYQMAISSTVNRRADNATMANLKMILKKKIVKNLKPGDPLYTGKIIETNDPFRDVREFSLSEIYPSTINEEQLLQGRAERLAGVNEGSAGAAMPVTRTTASAQLALLQEQAKRIDMTVKGIRSALNELGWYTLQIYSQFGTGGKAIAWLGDKGYAVEAIFRLPRGVKELGYGIKVNTPTSIQNRQVKRENKLALFNLLIQLHKEVIPFAQAFAPEQMGMLAGSLVSSAKKYMVDVLETFEESDPEGVLAGLTTLEKLLPAAEDLGGLERFEGAVSRAETLDAVARLERTLEEARVVGEGSRTVRPERGDAPRVSAPEGILRGAIERAGILQQSGRDGEP